jgi:hypothetical protein
MSMSKGNTKMKSNMMNDKMTTNFKNSNTQLQKRKLEEPLPGQFSKSGLGLTDIASSEDKLGENALTRAQNIQSYIDHFMPSPRGVKVKKPRGKKSA